MESLGPLVLPPNPSYRASSVSFLLHVPDHPGSVFSKPSSLPLSVSLVPLVLAPVPHLLSSHPAEQTSRLFTRFLPALSYTLAVSSLQGRVFRELIVFFHLDCTSYCLAIDRQEPVSDQIDEYLQLANPALPTRRFNDQQPTANNQHAYRDRTRRTNKPSRF